MPRPPLAVLAALLVALPAAAEAADLVATGEKASAAPPAT
jgi:hypothetical protein